MIDKEKYKIKPINRFKTHSPKTQILLALSLRKDNNHIIRLQHKDFGKTKKWCTYSITREGQIYQHYDPKYHSNFTGVKNADKQSISIVLENMGSLFESTSGEFVNWISEKCVDENVGERKRLGQQYWEKVPTEQIKATVELCQLLSSEFGIPARLIDFSHYHKDIRKYRGIVFRSNYIEESGDGNPFLDISKFNELLEKDKSIE